MIIFEKIKYKFIRLFFFIIFLAFYYIALAVNIDKLEDSIDFFAPIKQKTIRIDEFTYSGAFQNSNNMLLLVKKYKIKRVISLMDPRIPIYKELNAYEEIFCKKNNIEFINIPVEIFNQKESKIDMIKNVLKEKKMTYINGYLDDRGIHNLIIH